MSDSAIERGPTLVRMGLLLVIPTVPTEGLFEYLCDLCGAAEAAGFDSVWLTDHFCQTAPGTPVDQPILEAYGLLAGLAARTSRMRLGTVVSGVTHRHPAVLAKQVTTLDVISGGRAVVGLGAAWNGDEHAAYGIPFGSLDDRFDLLSDAAQICRLMFRNPSTTFSGKRISVVDAMNVPQPITPGGPPILIGGSGVRRTLRIVAEHADISNTVGLPADQRILMHVLDRHCEGIGRDPSTITRTAVWNSEPFVFPQAGRASPEAALEDVNSYLEAGIDGIMVVIPSARLDRQGVTAVAELLSPLLWGHERRREAPGVSAPVPVGADGAAESEGKSSTGELSEIDR